LGKKKNTTRYAIIECPDNNSKDGKGGEKTKLRSITAKKMAKWEGKLLPRSPLFNVKS
jgi:hypothetical protein